LSKIRIMAALMLGQLERSRLYHEDHVPEFSFAAVDGPTAVATDGEVDGHHQNASFGVRYRALPVFRPLPNRRR
jgi:undecaprenyl-diphosphatase